jgi:hypothetical protein
MAERVLGRGRRPRLPYVLVSRRSGYVPASRDDASVARRDGARRLGSLAHAWCVRAPGEPALGATPSFDASGLLNSAHRAQFARAAITAGALRSCERGWAR